jgi:hypothetical protein
MHLEARDPGSPRSITIISHCVTAIGEMWEGNELYLVDIAKAGRKQSPQFPTCLLADTKWVQCKWSFQYPNNTPLGLYFKVDNLVAIHIKSTVLPFLLLSFTFHHIARLLGTSLINFLIYFGKHSNSMSLQWK